MKGCYDGTNIGTSETIFFTVDTTSPHPTSNISINQRSGQLVFDNARATKKYVRGFLVTEEKGNYSVYINIWIDDIAQTQQSVDLSGAGAVWGTMVWGSFTWAGGVLIDKVRFISIYWFHFRRKRIYKSTLDLVYHLTYHFGCHRLVKHG